MIDFLKISVRPKGKGITEIYPKFFIKKSDDLMIRGRDFYAIWNEELGLWSTDEQDALQIIDRELDNFARDYREKSSETIRVLYMQDAESGMIDVWHKYCQKQMRDNFVMLDENIIFSNVKTTRKDYASKRLSYPLEAGDIKAYDKLISTLYSPEERKKIEWAIGSIITGDSKKIQKFLVLYGAAGTGKSTILNIIQQLFEGYYSVFDAKALGSSSNSFALEAFKTNPLVAIQHDGDLSKIEDNTRLNSLVSHELMTVNEKFKSTYSNRFKCFLFMGTNKPVRITDAKSGLIRRLIDVKPSGNKLSPKEYRTIMKQIEFELGAIAYHCQDVYLDDPGAYDNYIPIEMMGASNDFYNFVMDSYYIYEKDDSTTLKASWEMYQTYCENAKVPYPYTQRIFKEELKNYFREFREIEEREDGTKIRGYYTGFKTDKFDSNVVNISDKTNKKDTFLNFKEQKSILDDILKDCLAQYATNNETPFKPWDDVKTKLSDINTSKLHYVLIPEEMNHIVADFDLKDENGNKSLEKNIAAASEFPQTYAELSKSGCGIHLHYLYSGDTSMLKRLYSDGIEIKVFTGKSSLRRKLTKCNDLPIATLNSGLPLKEGEKKMINEYSLKNENAIRTIIKKNLNKEYHPNTKPSIDFIYKTLEDAYASGISYDVSDMMQSVLIFAANSTNNSDYCLKLVNKMRFKSEDAPNSISNDNDDIVFFDVEVFPNLFLVNWKRQGKDKPVVRMINPSSEDIEKLIKFRLIGFNCRRYDNHILYGRLIGYSNEELYKLSQNIISGNSNSFFSNAYNISYTDIYDFAATKQSLKKWEIELNIIHKELGFRWDEPVPEDRWVDVAEYCDNDVIATEAVFDHLKGDWTARQILADLAEMSVNDTTNTLTTKIIFGNERKPKLVYTDLETGEPSDPKFKRDDIITGFPGYKFENGKNMYRGIDLGFGGYVYSEPGMYTDVALLDVASLHPNSIRAMNCFGEYTKNFNDILDARVSIKHGDFESVRNMFNGRLAKYLDDESTAKDLAQALKIAINSVYGLTSASFDNPFRDIRNKNNIVALRGALFMKTLQDEVQKQGFTVAHIKTDSIKIPNATPEIVQFCMEFGKKYGYTFEHEATYERMCLVNDAVYIAKYKDGKHAGEWTATGTQFQVPYVFKSLFSKEKIEFEDLCETKSVTSALYLDMNEDLPDVTAEENVKMIRRKPSDQLTRRDNETLLEWKNVSDEELDDRISKGHNYIFIGKISRFCPIKNGYGGGILYREGKDPKTGERKFMSATGAKDYRWLESEMVRTRENIDIIDISYYEKLANEAIKSISEYGDFEWFIS